MLTDNPVIGAWINEVSRQPRDAPEPSSDEASELPQHAPLLSVSRDAMACEFEVLLNRGEYKGAADVAVEALDLVQQLERKLSIYRTDSELSTINRFAARRPIPMSSETFRLLELGQAISKLTAGAFDMTAGQLSEAWGFSRRQGTMPTESEIAESLASVGCEHLQLLASERQATFEKKNTSLNPGGIGKGFALDRAAELLTDAGVEAFMMHGGSSSVIAAGDRAHPKTGGGWLVALKHPFQPQQVLGTVRLKNEALGTSGSGKQFFHFKGRRYSHIIDPRTGYPAEGLCSATVITKSAAVSDALATALFVLGRDEARNFLTEHSDVTAILTFRQNDAAPIEIETHNASDDVWQLAE